MSTPELRSNFDSARLIHTAEQYPAPQGEYAVKTKDGNQWRQHKNARLQISVGQEAHDGEKFKSTIEWTKNRFTKRTKSKVYICINDSLQRWNYVFAGMSHKQASEQAIKLGDEWMERNSSIYNQIPNAQFTRWESWVNHEDYSDALANVRYLYDNNGEFRDAIDKNIDEFWNRQKSKKNLEEERFADFKHYSKEYLLEETAVFSLMFRDDPAVDIYPGTVLLPCVIFQGRTDIANLPEGLGTGTFQRIDHVKNNGHKKEPGNTPPSSGEQPTTLPANQNQEISKDGPLAALGRMMAPHFGNPHVAFG